MQDKGGLQKLQAMAFNPAPSNPEEYQSPLGVWQDPGLGFGKPVATVISADLTPR